MKPVDVTVVGGGMIGMATACLLAREGFQVLLVDLGNPPAWQENMVPGRVSALNLATRCLLENIGVWDTIKERNAMPYQAMSVWDSHSNAQIHFDAGEESVEALGYIVENDLVAYTMYERLRQNYQVTLKYGCKVATLESADRNANEDDTVRVGLDNGEIVTSGLVVAADGARSSLRELAGIELVTQDFQQDAIVATLSCSTPHHDTAFQVFTPEGPIALLPLTGERCSLVWSRDREMVPQLMSLDESEFCGLLAEHFADHIGELRLLGERLRFPLRSRHASGYLADRLVLVGDAAHTVHPLAGLGANLGIQDAAALVETLSAAKAGGKRIGSQSVLRRYERWRRGENGLAINAMKGFKSIFGSSLAPVRQARESGFALADSVMPLKHILAQYALGVRGDLPAACRPSVDL